MTSFDDFDPHAAGPSFSPMNKLERIIFGSVWLVLARLTPPPLHGWRRLLLRAFGARIGRNARIHASVRIWLPRNLEIGENALIGPGARLYNQGQITIGANCVISQRAHICASTHSLSDPAFKLVLRPVRIENGCWVAAEAFVGPGVTMAPGCVLAARAALFGNGEAMAVYRGNPAQRIKDRVPHNGNDSQPSG